MQPTKDKVKAYYKPWFTNKQILKIQDVNWKPKDPAFKTNNPLAFKATVLLFSTYKNSIQIISYVRLYAGEQMYFIYTSRFSKH